MGFDGPARERGLFSVVIPSLNEGQMLHMTIDSIRSQTEYPSYEVIVVDDGSTDGSCDRYRDQAVPGVRIVQGGHLGVAGARNLGASHARGEYVVFLDAHCRVSPNWLARFATALNDREVAVVGPCFTRLEAPDPKGCGMNWADWTFETIWYHPVRSRRAYEVPLTPGGCQAFRAEIFMDLGVYEQRFRRWGCEDLEICLRAWLLGYRVQVDPQVIIAHHFREARNFEVAQEEILRNFLILAHLHLEPRYIRRFLAAIRQFPKLESTIDDIYRTDIFEARDRLRRRRVRDDTWFLRTLAPHLLERPAGPDRGRLGGGSVTPDRG